MAKVTPLKAPPAGKNFGTFKVEKFSMFEEADLEKYAELRNRAADVSTGIKIELMREYSRKTTSMEGGDPPITTTTEEIILVVHYWEKSVTRERGDNRDEELEAKDDLTPGPGRLVPARPLSSSGLGR